MSTENEQNKHQNEIVSENQSEEVVNEQPVAEEETAESKLQQELKLTQDQLAEVKDKHLRLYSEFENFRRRTAKEKLEMIQSANEQLIKSLLPVIDDFERAEKAMVATPDNQQIEGFVLIHNKLKKVVEQFGVKPMPLEVGADFDADTQEAITQIPAPQDSLKGKVVDVIEKGYLLNDKVIRYAKVVVGN